MNLDPSLLKPETIEKIRRVAENLNPEEMKSMTPNQILELMAQSGINPNSIRNEMRPAKVKIGPNESCLCGSGKKYKKCCRK